MKRKDCPDPDGEFQNPTETADEPLAFKQVQDIR